MQDDGGTLNGGIDTDPTPKTITMNVTPVNDAPVAVSDGYDAQINVALTGSSVLANDTDVDTVHGSLTATKVTDPAHGVLVLNSNGTFTYTPNSGYIGTDTFTYKANDGSLDSNVATVSISVTASPLSLDGDSYNGVEDTTLGVAAGAGLLDNDTDATPGAVVTVTAVNGVTANVGSQITLASGAHLTVNADGSFSYIPSANFNGGDSFTYTASDNGGFSATATVGLNISAVNDAPAGADTTVTTLEDTPYVFTTADFGVNDAADAGSASGANHLSSVKIDALPSTGSLTYDGAAITQAQVTAGFEVSAADIVAGKLVFTPSANANGAADASFSFQVRDDGGTVNGGIDLDPTANTITVDVTSVNDAPSGADKTVTTAQNTRYIFTAADFGFTDAADAASNAGADAFAGIEITTLLGCWQAVRQWRDRHRGSVHPHRRHQRRPSEVHPGRGHQRAWLCGLHLPGAGRRRHGQ